MSENERKFREMWSWIAEETRRQKRRVERFEYFNAFDISKDERPYCDCYACKEGIQRAHDDGYDIDYDDLIVCCYCPINWNNGGQCTEDGTLFDDWRRAYLCEDAAEIAEQIAQMEWRDKDE